MKELLISLFGTYTPVTTESIHYYTFNEEVYAETIAHQRLPQTKGGPLIWLHLALLDWTGRGLWALSCSLSAFGRSFDC